MINDKDKLREITKLAPILNLELWSSTGWTSLRLNQIHESQATKYKEMITAQDASPYQLLKLHMPNNETGLALAHINWNKSN